jgi:hypothetical protein
LHFFCQIPDWPSFIPVMTRTNLLITVLTFAALALSSLESRGAIAISVVLSQVLQTPFHLGTKGMDLFASGI